ncbi:MAG: hypothetical protein ABMA25_08235 [Ilumatobacteraceae bacterium]
MSEEMIEVVLSHAGQSRRAFLSKLVVGSAAFAVPVIASFTIGGKATPKRSPLNVDAGVNGSDGGSNIIIVVEGPNTLDCGPNTTDCGANLPDEGSNLPDCGPNTMVDCGSNETDGGSNDLDGGSNDQDSGAGVPGGSGIPATE